MAPLGSRTPSLKNTSFSFRLLDHCDDKEADALRSKIYSSCTEILKSDDSSPHLLSTIMDLEREEGSKQGDRTKMQSAIEVRTGFAHLLVSSPPP